MTNFPYLGTTNTVIYTTYIMHIVDCYLTTEINLQLFLIQLAELLLAVLFEVNVFLSSQ